MSVVYAYLIMKLFKWTMNKFNIFRKENHRKVKVKIVAYSMAIIIGAFMSSYTRSFDEGVLYTVLGAMFWIFFDIILLILKKDEL